MQKATIYLIVTAVLCFTALGLTGEYLSYSYYSSLIKQQAQQALINAPPPSDTGQIKSGSSENSIISFDFSNPMAVGNVDQNKHTVTLIVPPDTDVINLTPTVLVSQYAIVSPASGVPQDFMNPVEYTVTAQNGAIQKYTVTVNVLTSIKGVGKSITSFKLSGFSPEVDGVISEEDHTITVIVPNGTDLTKLTPIIGVSDNATVSPASGSVQDFTNPVTYTVTDSLGSKQDYTIMVVAEGGAE